MQIFDISVGPGEIDTIYCSGSYIYFYSGSAGGADTTITVKKDSDSKTSILMPGQALKGSGKDCTVWKIGNLKGQGTIMGRVVIGDGELTDNRVTGAVEVIDGGFNRTISGSAFIANTYTAALAGNYSIAQLFNPVGSGKKCLVKSLIAASSIQGGITVSGTSTALGTLSQYPKSKMIGGADSVISTRLVNTTTFPVAQSLASFFVQASGAFGLKLEEPIVLTEGNGILVIHNTINADLAATFEMIEFV